MWLDLSKIRTAHSHHAEVYRPEAFASDQESFRVIAPVLLAFEIAKDKNHYRLAGGVQTTLELACCRCLEPFSCPVDAIFDLRYHPQTANTGEGEREIEEDDLTTAFFENEQIDLGQLMREQFYLSLPMKPLCHDDCKGLCPTCGTNLERGTCNCASAWEDPRLSALKGLQTRN